MRITGGNSINPGLEGDGFPTEAHTVFNERTKTNEVVLERIDRPVLALTGYVVPGKDGQASVSPFTLLTEKDPEFSKLFQQQFLLHFLFL